MENFGQNDPITGVGASPSTFGANDPPYQPPPAKTSRPLTDGTVGGTALDMAHSAATNVGETGLGLFGQFGDVRELAAHAIAWGIEKTKGKEAADNFRANIPDLLEKNVSPMGPAAPTTAEIKQGVEDFTGKFYEAHTQLGKYFGNVAGFVPAALLTKRPGGSTVGAVTSGAVVPGIASEAAGQLVEGTAAEAYVRAFTAIGTGALASGAEAAMNPETVAKFIKSRLPASVDPGVVDRAQALVSDAATRGIKLTWPEALSQVAGQGVLTDTQRVLESSPKTAATFQPMMAARPGEIDAAGKAQFGQIAPTPTQPSTIGPAAADAAERSIVDVRQAINRATRPMYDAAGQTLVPPIVHNSMMGDPQFAAALHEIRNNPDLNAGLLAQSDRSINVYQAVASRLQERASNASNPLQPNTSQRAASNIGEAAGNTKQAAIVGERMATNGPSALEAAQARNAALRTQYLDPLLQGPLGKVASAPETRRAADALFPTAPLANSEGEVADAVRRMAQVDPDAARALVRAHLEGNFNEATQALQGGANQFGGAKFAVHTAGNLQQRLNLQAAIEALPGGQNVWPGVNRFMEIVQATGQRQQRGSMTAFNEQELGSLSKGGAATNTAGLIASPGSWPSWAKNAIAGWQMGSNMKELARIFTDPRSGPLLREIAGQSPASPRAAVLAQRLMAIGGVAANQASPNQPAATPSP